jgi:hypothetical protein
MASVVHLVPSSTPAPFVQTPLAQMPVGHAWDRSHSMQLPVAVSQ